MICLGITLIYWKFRAVPINWHGNIPDHLKYDKECLDNGIVPAQLSGAVPLEYMKSEGWSVTSRIERTFVHEGKIPKWNLALTMSNPKQISHVAVLYNLDGTIYEY